ncbi:hypothetical protein LOZ53_000555 [Ophidiomyces ophidiicola]|nr:hypothetical protein LOZ55_001359 [Ophidiomyces ophidiicola]KAI1997376.1 hypothetical protein LOZ53_000555 [Ophidiomyces ophidiicola]KAI1999511.1 hypothetical protein LOZ51_001999 [Ophidiomyces ophidiicola]
MQSDLEFQSPLIFDESVDFSDPEESRFAGTFSDGLLAKSGGALSMATYGKCPPANLLDFNGTTGGFSHEALSSYPQGSYSGQIYTPVLESHPVSDDESIHYVANNSGYAGSPVDFPRSPSLDVSARPAPEIISCDPSNGAEGTKFSAQIRAGFDVVDPVPWSFAFIFGSCRRDCSIARLRTAKASYEYVLMADAPPFSATQSTSLKVPVQLIMDDPEGPTAHVVQVCVFNYQQCLDAISPASRKRRMSCGSDDTSASTNSASVKHLRVKDSPRSSVYAESLSASPYSPYLPTPTSMTSYSGPQRIPSPLPPTQLEVYNVSQSRVKAPSPLASSWSPAFPDSTIADFNPRFSVSSLAQTQDLPMSVRAGQNPTLIRTSTIQQSLGGSNVIGQPQPFNPYAMYPSKAILKLNGDLDTMADNWTKDEQECQRRLVQFTRQQTGSTIHADFKPVTAVERVPNSICISCIYWAGKKECFVTSVDTIYLLESLVGVRFTVEEKNRIRRNLEGFRPLTVSKTKAESEDFFKVIMGFPNPKPRNIEKDVKVFPWRILAHALKKIIGKYSASYSSTAGTLQAPLASNFPVHGSANGTMDFHAGSQQSIVDVSAPGVSPHLRVQMYGHAHQGPANPPVRVVMPSIEGPQTSPYQFHGTPAPHRQMPSPAMVHRQHPQHQHQHPHQHQHHPFDFNTFVSNNSVSAPPNVPHDLAYSYPGSFAAVNRDGVPSPYVLGHHPSTSA